MKYRISFELNGPKQKEASKKGLQGAWDFKGIRQSLLRQASSGRRRPDAWDFSGIRKTLWGK